ncbi:MAG: NYN domain-containing protein [Candidatus Edwardsbacteria bacterium]|nr:NYN domain-containing protein [Candidatus Edwardsbacteria bacterium]
MARHIIIDGYNLAFALKETRGAVRSDQDKARQILLDLLRRYKKSLPAEITVVFDGREVQRERHQRISGIEVKYSRPPATADDEIRSMVNAAKDPGRLLVVSSDREVSQYVRRRGAETVRSDEFGDRLFAVLDWIPENQEKPAAADVEHWLKLFVGKRPDDD